MKTKLNISILFLIVLLDQASFGVLLPIFSFLFSDGSHVSLVQEQFSSINYVLYGVFFATFSIFQFFSATILGELSDYYGRKRIISISVLLVLLSFVLYIIGIRYEIIYILFLGRILAGVAAGCLGVIFASVSDISDEITKAKNFSIIASASGLGLIVGPLVGGVFTDTKLNSGFNFYTPLYLLLILNALCLLLYISFSKETLTGKIKKKMSLHLSFLHIKRSLTDTDLRYLYLISFFFTSALSSFMVFGSSFLIKKLSLTLSEINVLLFCFGVCILLAQIVLQGLYRKMHKLKILRLFSIIFLSGLLFVSNTGNIMLVYVALTFIAFSIGIIYPTMLNIIDDHAGNDDRGEKLGINTSVQSLAQAVSILGVGALTYFISIDYILYAVMLFVFVVFLFSKYAPTRRKIEVI